MTEHPCEICKEDHAVMCRECSYQHWQEERNAYESELTVLHDVAVSARRYLAIQNTPVLSYHKQYDAIVDARSALRRAIEELDDALVRIYVSTGLSEEAIAIGQRVAKELGYEAPGQATQE